MTATASDRGRFQQTRGAVGGSAGVEMGGGGVFKVRNVKHNEIPAHVTQRQSGNSQPAHEDVRKEYTRRPIYSSVSCGAPTTLGLGYR